MDNYFSRPEVSNSDLSKLKEMLYPDEEAHDPTEAFRMGTLVDAMITEPEKVNFFNFTCDGVQYTAEEFDLVKKMKRSFMADEMCRKIFDMSEFQKVMIAPNLDFEYEVPFRLSCRCKWDLWLPYGWGGDIKSTTATTQKQFEEACMHFDYDRQRFWYMNIARSERDILIGISKVNFKVFKIHINKSDSFYNSGKEKAIELAYKYWLRFGEV